MGQANIQAALLLVSYGNAALSPNNPYLHSSTQAGGVTFPEFTLTRSDGTQVTIYPNC